MNPLKTGYLRACAVCTRPLLGGEGHGNEARLIYADMYVQPQTKNFLHMHDYVSHTNAYGNYPYQILTPM